MGWRIVQQPNGKFSRFSDVVDDFTHMNLSYRDAFELCVQEGGWQAALGKMHRAMLDEGEDKTEARWPEAIDQIATVHGASRAREREVLGVQKKTVWRSCSGCHELNEGYPTGPYSDEHSCHLGGGCDECNGVGAVVDELAMLPTEEAQQAPLSNDVMPVHRAQEIVRDCCNVEFHRMGITDKAPDLSGYTLGELLEANHVVAGENKRAPKINGKKTFHTACSDRLVAALYALTHHEGDAEGNVIATLPLGDGKHRALVVINVDEDEDA